MSREDVERTDHGLTEERYRRLVDHSPNAICVHQRGRLHYVNEAGLEWMRAASADELIGRPLTDFIDFDSIEAVSERAAELREIGDCSEPWIVRMVRLDGTRLDVEAVSVLTLWEGERAYQVICRDVSAQRAAEATLRYQAALVDRISDAIIAIDDNYVVKSWNRAAETIYGRCAKEAIGMPAIEALGAELGVMTSSGGGVFHSVHHHTDGTALDVRVSVARIDTGYVLVSCDLTAQRRAEQHFASVVESLEEGVVVLDKNGMIKSLNPAAMRLVGISQDQIGTDFFERTGQFALYDANGNNIPPGQRPAEITIRTGEPFSHLVLGFDHVEGHRAWLTSCGRLLHPGLPGQSDVLITFSDITDQRAASEQLVYRATHDPLTRLPNREYVLSKIAASEHVRTVVVYIDLDDLKATNDTLGHKAGDDLLCATADRLLEFVGPGDVVGRLGGDEFIVLICDSAPPEDLADKLKRHLARPVSIASTTTPIRASVGLVEVLADDRRTAEEILRDADLAMYEAKRAGRNRR
ncbi:diguanylate cyclase domain-containing protein [Mycobacterium deserti]|uniref:Diguanylate cyclase n=1 Tax=Mycobacterium deserti TaxID=2978347 RepID=A0ABT2M7Z1_9MYCO|nr:diguanylate cyclase [Mycobacterium deserti]MCT7658387.1 diguanylate cyclase [Mycobacterium deserti]